MEHCRSVLFDTKRLTHLDCKAAHKANISIMDKDFRESYTFEHVFQIELGDSLSCYHFVARYEDDCHSAIVVGNREYRVKTI